MASGSAQNNYFGINNNTKQVLRGLRYGMQVTTLFYNKSNKIKLHIQIMAINQGTFIRTSLVN